MQKPLLLKKNRGTIQPIAEEMKGIVLFQKGHVRKWT